MLYIQSGDGGNSSLSNSTSKDNVFVRCNSYYSVLVPEIYFETVLGHIQCLDAQPGMIGRIILMKAFLLGHSHRTSGSHPGDTLG